MSAIVKLEELSFESIRHLLLLGPRDEGVICGTELGSKLHVAPHVLPTPWPVVVATDAFAFLPQVSDTGRDQNDALYLWMEKIMLTLVCLSVQKTLAFTC